MENQNQINKNRKYNTEFRKKLASKFDNIRDKQELIDIYNIIISDIGNNFSSNRNGIFINMNILSDNCIDKLINFIEDKNNLITECENNYNYNYNPSYKPYKMDDIEVFTELGYKLSNQEKNIIKRIRNKS